MTPVHCEIPRDPFKGPQNPGLKHTGSELEPQLGPLLTRISDPTYSLLDWLFISPMSLPVGVRAPIFS